MNAVAAILIAALPWSHGAQVAQWCTAVWSNGAQTIERSLESGTSAREIVAALEKSGRGMPSSYVYAARELVYALESGDGPRIERAFASVVTECVMFNLKNAVRAEGK